MQDEIWKNTEYDGYMVSNLGRVKSLDRSTPPDNTHPNGQFFQGKILSTRQNIHAYESIMVSRNPDKRVYVHRLVAEAFIPNPENKCEINHKNGNKKDNRVENLEWVTRSENILHAMNTGLMSKTGYHTPESNKKISETVKRLWAEGVYKPKRSEDWTPEERERARQAQLNSPNKKRGDKHPKAKAVKCVETGEIFGCLKFAALKYGKKSNRVHIGECARGKRNIACGFHWKFV